MSLIRSAQDWSAKLLVGAVPGARLAVQSGGCGFFGDLFMALNGMRFAERHRLACEIAWGERSLYFDPQTGGDAWSNYFKQSRFDFSPSSFKRRSIAVPYFPGAQEFFPYDGLTVRQSISEAIASFCSVRTEITDKVDHFTRSKFCPGGMVGVHVRMTDAARGEENRRVLSIDHFVRATEDALREHALSGVFLASDDASVVDQFRKEFGETVVTTDSIRSLDGTSLHGHYDGGVSGNPRQKGEEVLIDALLLAKCGFIVRGHSRVTCFSLCLAPQIPFIDLDFIHLGKNSTPWLHS